MSPNHARAACLRERLEQRLSRSPSEHAYPVADWQIVERAFQREYLPALESVFAVANGYLGLRGTPEEGTPTHEAGAVLNGVHETWPIVYPEDAYGLARTGQTIVNATDGTLIRLFVDDEPFDLTTAKLLRFERVLDMQIDHRRHVEDFWSRSDVQLEGAPDLQQAVRFNLFELMQATARGEGLGVPAKGLTGHGYEGHYF